METIQTASQFAATALIASIWQGVLLAVALWVCIKVVPRTSARVRFMLWVIAFAAISVLPMLAILPGHKAEFAVQTSTHAWHALQFDSRWALAIASLWAVFTAVRIAALARSAFRLRSLWRHSSPVATPPAMESLLATAGPRRAVLCTSAEVDQPCVIGFVSPRILVPAWLLAEATSGELQQIVLHEVAHLQRFDDWTNLLQKLALTCFPLNPALMWVERRLSAEREAACDEIVIAATRAPRAYASCLANLAEHRLSHRAAALSLGAWEHRSQLAGRIETILRGGADRHPLKANAIAAAAALASVGGIIALGSTVQLVSFAPFNRSQAVALTSPGVTPGTAYRDVVFHAPSVSNQSQLHADVAQPATQTHLRPVMRRAVRRADSMPGDDVQSFIIVTRWQDASGQQMTVINRVVRISAASAAPSQAGWFFLQL